MNDKHSPFLTIEEVTKRMIDIMDGKSTRATELESQVKIAPKVDSGPWAELVRLRKINYQLLKACQHAIATVESNPQHPMTSTEIELRAAIRQATEQKP